MSSSMDLNAVQVGQYTDATINSEGQLVLTGGADPSNLNGMCRHNGCYRNLCGAFVGVELVTMSLR